MKKILLFAVIALFITGALAIWKINPAARSANTVVVYVSEDQVFSQPVLRDFEKETGITVKAVYDTEETKSTGVMIRLLAEKDNPQAGVEIV